MRDFGSLRGLALVLTLALATAACGGSSPATAEPTLGSAGKGGGDAAPENLELGHEYRHEMAADATTPARFTFEVPPGSIVQVEGTADTGNRASIVLRPSPPSGLNLGISLEPGQSDTTQRWIHNDTGGGRWVLEIAGLGGDAVTFTVSAPLQADGGGSGDAGGHAGTAFTIEPGQALSGLLGDEDQEDWYAIPLGGGDVVSVTLEVPPTEAGSTSVNVIFNGTRLASTQANPGGTSSMTQVFAQNQSGTAQLQVQGRGAYQFTVEAGPQQDGGSDGDAGGNLADAKAVDFGAFEGVLGGEDREDFYVLSLPLDAVLNIEATIAPDFLGSARIEVNFNGRNVISNAVPAGGTNQWLYALVNPADAKAYVRVAAGQGSYALTIAATTQPDGDGAGDAPGERAQAKQVEPTGSFQGILNNAGSADSRDWYRFEATENGTLEMQLAVDATGSGQTRMQVHDGTRRVGDVTTGAGGTNTVSFDVTAGTVYEFELGTGGLAPYTITFN